MTLKELLDEQEKKFGEHFCVMLERSLYTDEEIEGVYTFLRQSNIETVEWVIGILKERQKTLERYDGIQARIRKQELEQRISELNKAIKEDEKETN